jgi:alpha-mannosidase
MYVPCRYIYSQLIISVSGMVYDDSEVLYAEIKRDGEALIEEALSVLFPNSVALTPATRSKSLAGSCKIVAYNTTFFPRWDIIKVPLTKAGSSLKSQILQASDDGREGYAIVHCAKGASPGELKSTSNAVHAYLKPVSSKALSFLIRGPKIIYFLNSIYQRI